MKKKTLQAIVLGLVLLSAAAPLAAGDIYVGGPWGTRISRLPYLITAPGAYYLGGNLTYTGTSDGITVAAGVNHVTLDLMGFTLNGSNWGRYGIFMTDSKNVEIRNGTLTDWGTGIGVLDPTGGLHRIINVRAVGNARGIFSYGVGILVQNCEATAIGSNRAIDVRYSTVRGCIVKFADGYGISTIGGIISANVVTSNGTYQSRCGITASSGSIVKDNRLSSCGYGIFGLTALTVIGNTVDAAAGTTGISLTDDYSNLLDQNTVTGAGTHYNATYTKIQQRNNY